MTPAKSSPSRSGRADGTSREGGAPSAPRRVGFALGVWDFCHAGHVALLRRASELCDVLIVGVHTDEFAASYKRPPRHRAEERARAVRDLGIADSVVVTSSHEECYRRYGVTHVFHGDDWDAETYRNWIGRGLLAAHGVELVMLPHTPGLHSEQLRRGSDER